MYVKLTVLAEASQFPSVAVPIASTSIQYKNCRMVAYDLKKTQHKSMKQ